MEEDFVPFRDVEDDKKSTVTKKTRRTTVKKMKTQVITMEDNPRDDNMIFDTSQISLV